MVMGITDVDDKIIKKANEVSVEDYIDNLTDQCSDPDVIVFLICFSHVLFPIVYAWANEYTLTGYQRDLFVLVKEVQV